MKKQIKPLLLLFLLPLQLLAQSVKSDITIRHINVVDVKSGAIQKNQLVVIKDHKITDIRLDNKKLSLTTTSLDGTDKYLIPGLWDMHSHNNWDVDSKAYKFPMMLANGVTGLRYMLGTKKELQLRDSINQNLLVAPRLVVGSPLVNGPDIFYPNNINLKEVSQIPKVVDSLQNIGYDFIKVYSFLRSDLFFALAEYCKKKKMVIAGHVPIGVTAEQASAAGMLSLEHLAGLRRSFSSRGEQLSQQWEKELKDTTGYMAYINILFKSDSFHLPFDSIKAKEISQTLIANHTAVTPTITAFQGFEYDRDTLLKMTSLAYIKKAKQQEWYNFRNAVSNEKGWVQNALRLLNFLNKQGVMILAGTDNEIPFVINGFSLHEELAFYVQAGLTPLQALQTATLNPAIFLHRKKELGTVSKGKLADLVILDSNPLTNIANTRKIHAVIMNGHLIDKAQMNQSLQKIKEEASR